MTPIIIANARVLTLKGPPGARRGAALRDLGLIEDGWVKVEQGR